jgi:hypothetical protein
MDEIDIDRVRIAVNAMEQLNGMQLLTQNAMLRIVEEATWYSDKYKLMLRTMGHTFM